MRMMLGNGEPLLLVYVHEMKDRENFNFEVINGGWEGQIKDGHLIVKRDNEDHGVIDILCDNQDRLRGKYQDVFLNFHDVNYVAPQDVFDKTKYSADFDDDIPF